MVDRIQELKGTGNDQQIFHKMNGIIPFSGKKAIYSLSKMQWNKQPTDIVDGKSVSHSFDPQVQKPIPERPNTNQRAVTNKYNFRGRNQTDIYNAVFTNGAPQFREQYTVIPIAGRNEGFRTTTDYRFWAYQGVVSNTSRSRVKNADSHTLSSSARSVGNIINNASKSPVSTNAIRKASGAWK